MSRWLIINQHGNHVVLAYKSCILTPFFYTSDNYKPYSSPINTLSEFHVPSPFALVSSSVLFPFVFFVFVFFLFFFLVAPKLVSFILGEDVVEIDPIKGACVLDGLMTLSNISSPILLMSLLTFFFDFDDDKSVSFSPEKYCILNATNGTNS